eukprot:CAMPEP_0198600530 /NCGR_PEP_ID=MMETSP1462-20131121/148336_1 /TAXON_ID=1333877 /ORGANISM="Brandtodinium nutriculum, Strain RCC3387" /LENGTH=58 /DNA_ID=CAMNT_0044332241 /DNA_START=346 /DNA_END=523 /DNA_ORIENTATION=+
MSPTTQRNTADAQLLENQLLPMMGPLLAENPWEKSSGSQRRYHGGLTAVVPLVWVRPK